MKLKYYLRGLGIGIVITTLILMIAYRLTNPISDEEIIKRAEKLGMVMEETEPEPWIPQTKEDNTSGEEQQSSEAEVSSNETSSTEDATSQETPTTTEVPTTEAPTTETSTTETATPEEVTTVAPTTESPTTNVFAYNLVIRGGMGSDTVAYLLKNAGIIDNEIAFDDFMVNNGYDVRLKVGSFTITSDMSFEQIARTIIE